MIDIKLDGEIPDGDELILEAIKQAIVKKGGDLVCPEHKEKAILTFKGKSTKDLSVNIHTCCDKFNAVISKRIKD